MTSAIVIGMLLGNTIFPRLADSCATGVVFSKQNLLRLGIVLYGLRLTFQDIAQVGVNGVLIDACILISTFSLAYVVGVKLFKLDRNAVMLIGAGSSICGAAAVMATEPVLRARSEQVTVAVSTVVVFGSAAIFLYPLLHGLSWWPAHADFSIYIGSTVHEVAQVVAAARSIDDHTANTAVIAKMVRVMMLAPFLLLLSAYVQRGRSATGPRYRFVGNGHGIAGIDHPLVLGAACWCQTAIARRIAIRLADRRWCGNQPGSESLLSHY